MKIVIVQAEDWEQKYLAQKLAGHDVTFFNHQLTPEAAEKLKDVEVISIFIYNKITEEILEKLPQLKLIVTRSTGYDHIDLQACRNRQIIVCNVPHYGTHTVAEHTFALILTLTRNIVKSVERTKQGNFDFKELTGTDLYGKTLGIVGLGDIGLSVLKIAKGFGMKVVAYTHHPDEELARKLNIHFLELKELFRISDVVSLHVPYSKETHHMINKKNIKKFKKGSILINTARGPLIETEALIIGLRKNILQGVGLDVLEEETTIKEERELLTEEYLKKSNIKTLLLEHILLSQKNVVITPHNAFNSEEALYLILDVTIENIVKFENGKPENTIQ
jgi:D-lactate dehydrogenase